MPPFLSLRCQIIRMSKLHSALGLTHCFLACRTFPMALGGKQAAFRFCIFTDEGNALLKVTLEPRAACPWTSAHLCPLGGCVTLGLALPSLAPNSIKKSELPSRSTLGSCDTSSTPPVPLLDCLLCNLIWGCWGKGLALCQRHLPAEQM